MTNAELIVGTWRMAATAEAGMRTVELRADGTMKYAIDIGDRVLVLDLTYRLDDGFVVTQQPPETAEIRSRYSFVDVETLLLEHGGETFTYQRVR